MMLALIIYTQYSLFVFILARSCYRSLWLFTFSYGASCIVLVYTFVFNMTLVHAKALGPQDWDIRNMCRVKQHWDNTLTTVFDVV